MISILAVLYFLGIFLHYVHILTIGSFVGNDDLDMRRVILFSVFWPLMTCWYFYTLVLTGGDDEDA